MKRNYMSIEAVIQRVPCAQPKTWYAGFGYHGTENTALFGGGSYLEAQYPTMAEAKQNALEIAHSYRNTVLTLGGCTFETLPPIVFRNLSRGAKS